MKKKTYLKDKSYISDLIYKAINRNIDNNKVYCVELSSLEYIENLKYYIRDCINFHSGYYRETIYSENKTFEDNKVDYVFDEYFVDNNGQYFLIIIKNRQNYFSPISIKIYFHLKKD